MTKFRGFTLIETVVAVGLTAIIMVVITTSLLSQNQIIQVASVRQARDSAYLEALNVIGRDTRIAVDAPATFTAPNGAQYTADATTLILQTYSLSANGALICNEYDYIVYKQEGSVLKQLTFPGTGSVRPSLDKQLVGNVTTVTFTKTIGQSEAGHLIVNAAVQTTQTVASQLLTKSYNQSVATRNH